MDWYIQWVCTNKSFPDNPWQNQWFTQIIHGKILFSCLSPPPLTHHISCQFLTIEAKCFPNALSTSSPLGEVATDQNMEGFCPSGLRGSMNHRPNFQKCFRSSEPLQFLQPPLLNKMWLWSLMDRINWHGLLLHADHHWSSKPNNIIYQKHAKFLSHCAVVFQTYCLIHPSNNILLIWWWESVFTTNQGYNIYSFRKLWTLSRTIRIKPIYGPSLFLLFLPFQLLRSFLSEILPSLLRPAWTAGSY